MEDQTNSTPNLIAALEQLEKQITKLETECKELRNAFDGVLCWLDAEAGIDV